MPLVSRFTGMVGRAEIAEASAEAVLSSPTADLFTTILARGGLALLAVQRDDAASAQEQYAALQSQQGTFLSVANLAFDHLLGLLAQTMRQPDKAAGHFEDALAFCRKAGYRPELAWTCCDYADALLQRNGPGDHQKAMTLLDESLAICSELGMRPLLERALSRRQILGA